MKLFDIIDLADQFKSGRMPHERWRVYTAIKLLEMEEDQAKVLAEHIVDFRFRDHGDV